MLDILLVRPGDKKRIYGSLSKSLAAIEPPMWVGLIAGYMRSKGVSVKIIDADAEGLSGEQVAHRVALGNPHLIGVVVSGTNPSASTMNMPGARAILAAVRERSPEKKTFIAGLHPSAVPEKTLLEEPVDYVIQGETFQTLPALLEIVKSGDDSRLGEAPGLWHRKDGVNTFTGQPELTENLDTLPMIAWDLLPMDKYRAHNWHCFDKPEDRQPYSVIYTSLGCPYSCEFCCINAIFGKPGIRYRSPSKVVEEIGLLVREYGVRNIKIMDEMFVLNRDHVFAICDGIIEKGYKLNIWAYARIDTISGELLAKMKQAGINWLAYGIEAGNQLVREGMAKGRFDHRKIVDAVELTRSAGISVGANYIFGLPEDNLSTMRETLDLAIELNCEYSNFYMAMPYPGSKLYSDAVAGGAPMPKHWESYSQFGEQAHPMPTKYLTSREIIEFRDNAFDEYYNGTRYINMLMNRFGKPAVEEIKRMREVKIKRKHSVLSSGAK